LVAPAAMVDKPAYLPCVSALPPDSVSVLALFNCTFRANPNSRGMNGIFWSSAVSIPMAIQAIPANHQTAPPPALVRNNVGSRSDVMSVKVLTAVDRFAPESWRSVGSSDGAAILPVFLCDCH
jgi:hypothetical protein